MSKYKGPMTAEELMKRLAADPEYVKMRAAKDEKSRERAKRLAAISRPILERLTDTGFPAESIEDLVRKFAPVPEQVVEILLANVNECSDDRIQESLVRALGAAEFPFDGRQLVKCFESARDEGLRFAILNTIALVKPHSIDEWLEKARQNDYLRQKLSDLGYKWTTP